MKLRKFLFAILIIFGINACGTRKLSPALVGNWQAPTSPITVREESSFMKFQFTRDSADFELRIDSNFQVEGSIGNAKIRASSIHCNWLLPTDQTGISYIIKLDLEGAIFEKDPLAYKEVELWLGTDFDGGEWELRYTEGMAQFPMAFPIFRKYKDGDSALSSP